MQVIGKILQGACAISARPKGLAQVIARNKLSDAAFGWITLVIHHAFMPIRPV